MVSATSRSSCAGPIFPATAATWASTNAAASTVSSGVEWMVTSARDGPRAPGRNASGVDLRPQPRQAVAELEGVADELLRATRS